MFDKRSFLKSLVGLSAASFLPAFPGIAAPAAPVAASSAVLSFELPTEISDLNIYFNG